MREYKIIRTERKSIGIQITKELEVIVRAPSIVPEKYLDEIVNEKADWIEKHIEIQKRKNQAQTAYEVSESDAEELKALAKKVIPPKVEYYSRIMGVKPSSVKITSAHSRFGSCSGKNAICFSYILMRYPEEAIDYVVVHELAHIKHHNHSRSFYNFIGKFMPDYKQREKLLRPDTY
ncbi:MAG: M48 family metallopeptidase [Clostridia bacterium]|nr:M48 family metallopeptidase [Clostridia bacterium]